MVPDWDASSRPSAFGRAIVNGAQTARINAVLVQPPEPDLPWPVALAFFDSQGNRLGDPDTFQLRDGAAVHSDFVIDPNSRVGDRLQIRAQVTSGDPSQSPGCAGGVLASVEVIDRLTRATHVILTNPAQREVARNAVEALMIPCRSDRPGYARSLSRPMPAAWAVHSRGTDPVVAVPAGAPGTPVAARHDVLQADASPRSSAPGRRGAWPSVTKIPTTAAWTVGCIR